MHLLVIFSLLGCVLAGDWSQRYTPPKPIYGPPKPVYGSPAPIYITPKQSYGAPKPIYGAPSQALYQTGGIGGGGNGGGFGGVYQKSGGFGQGYGSGYGSCGPGEILNVDGKCGKPILTQNFLVYSAPYQNYITGPPIAPPPTVDTNIVFVHAPKVPHPPHPIVVPDSEKRTAIFLLSKNQQFEGQKVIEVPTGPQQSPEVFYVNYDYGDNPILPGGVSLQEALNSANIQQGKIIGGIGAIGNYGGGVSVETSGSYGGGVSVGSVGNFAGGNSLGTVDSFSKGVSVEAETGSLGNFGGGNFGGGNFGGGNYGGNFGGGNFGGGNFGGGNFGGGNFGGNFGGGKFGGGNFGGGNFGGGNFGGGNIGGVNYGGGNFGGGNSLGGAGNFGSDGFQNPKFVNY